MTVTIVTYGASNVASIPNVFRRLGTETVISSDPDVVVRADRIVVPGVGAFDTAMANFRESGMIEALSQKARQGTPILGLCLGMQVLAESSEEGLLSGLGWIKGAATRLRPANSAPVPHMGWNTLSVVRSHPVFSDLQPDARFYFAHSYHVVCEDPDDVLATTEYGGDFASVVGRGNVLGIQFHPEKSHKHGLALLERFLSWG